VVPCEGEPLLTVDTIHESNAEYMTWIEDIRLWGAGGKTNMDRLVEMFQDLKLKRAVVGAELGPKVRLHMSILDYEEMRRRLPDVTFVNAESVLGEWQMVKSPLEIERIRKACEITCHSIAEGFKAARPGMTERELIAIIVCEMLKQGAEDPINATNRGSLALQADRVCQVNPSPVDRPIQEGDVIRVDGGAVYRSYCADMSRNAIVGRELSKELQRAQEACSYVLDETLNAIKPGVTSAEICAAAEKALHGVGFADKRRHCMDRVSVEKGSMIGHGLGFQHPEAPYICPSDETVWVEGMVGAIEFGLGTIETGFSDLEDDFLVTEDGCEILTPLQRNIWVSQG
jgi:Xaa-Pro dipeptidase